MGNNPAVKALRQLASVQYPDVDPFDPAHFDAVQSWREMTRHMATSTFNLMERHKIPHHPKFKKQYDRGQLSGPEYASLTLQHLYGA